MAISLDRRSFLAASAAGLTLASTSRAFAAKKKSDIRVAVIGLKGRGTAHIGGLAANVVALCDCDEKILASRADEFQSKYDRQVDTFVDYRKLLDRDDIDAVAIATPNHTHTLIAIAAMQAGKDVYVEKPVSHNIWEGRQLVAAAEKYNRIVQCGTQSRSSACLKDAVKWVQEGGLGKIKYIVGTCYKPRPSIGKLDAPLNIPAHIDYDLWCGPADKVDLQRPQLHYDWHWDFNTGAGDIGNQGIHQMDICRWFLGEEGLAPRSIAIGARLGYDDAGNTPNTQVVMHDYASAPIIFETRGLPKSKEGQKSWGRSMDRYRGSQVGVVVQCEEGYVFSPSSYATVEAFDNEGNEVKKWSGRSDHFANWMNAVEKQNSALLNAPIREGHLSSALCHVGNVSNRLGEPHRASEIAEMIGNHELLAERFDSMVKHLQANEVDVEKEPSLLMGPWLEVDPATEEFVGNDRASELRARRGRAGFEIPTLESVV